MGRNFYASFLRMFGGREFKRLASRPSKREAQVVAQSWRERGRHARVVRSRSGWNIYLRKP